MKKIILITITMLFLSSCNSAEEYTVAHIPEYTPEHIVEYTPEYIPAYIPEYAPAETIAYINPFLYDLDYLMQALEDTFPYFGVVERKLEIDIRQLMQTTRDIIQNYPYSLQPLAHELGLALDDMPPLDEQVFWSILYHEFFAYLSSFAHTALFNHHIFNANFSAMTSGMPAAFPLAQRNRWTFNTLSFLFYQAQEELFYTLAQEDPALFQFIFRFDPSELNEQPTDTADPLPTIFTEIIRENDIAYLNISSFVISPAGLMEQTPVLLSFYEEIQEYNHLIIDIRQSAGGNIDLWRQLILYPLMPNRENLPNSPVYVFFNDTDFARDLGQMQLVTEANSAKLIPATDYLLTVHELLSTNDLPHLNQNDLQNLGYGFIFNTDLGLVGSGPFDLRDLTPFPFEGQIWLLTSENNFSVSALFALHAKHMDFATLVGDQTGGGYTVGGVIYLQLPNTNMIARWNIDYLVDQYGRTLNEFHTTPHYFNREGLDALETVLQMIAE